MIKYDLNLSDILVRVVDFRYEYEKQRPNKKNNQIFGSR